MAFGAEDVVEWLLRQSPLGRGFPSYTLLNLVLLVVLLLPGCSVQPTLDAAAQAERRLGTAGSDALESVAALASSISASASPVASEASSLLASVRGRVDDAPHSTWWAIGAVGVLVAAHAAATLLKLRDIHRDLKERDQ